MYYSYSAKVHICRKTDLLMYYSYSTKVHICRKTDLLMDYSYIAKVHICRKQTCITRILPKFTFAGNRPFNVTRTVSKFTFARKHTFSLYYSYSAKVHICRKTDIFIVLLVYCQRSLLSATDLFIIPKFMLTEKQTFSLYYSYNSQNYLHENRHFIAWFIQ